MCTAAYQRAERKWLEEKLPELQRGEGGGRFGGVCKGRRGMLFSSLAAFQADLGPLYVALPPYVVCVYVIILDASM